MSTKACPTRKVPTAELVLDARCQARANVDHDAVREYADAYASGVTLPPPDVYSVSGKLIVVDGYHRVPAAISAGVEWLRVSIVGEGTIDEAVWHATGVNQGHGVRRTNADKRRAVLMALGNSIGVEQSSRAIAEHCGVSDQLVSKVRSEWEAAQVQEHARGGHEPQVQEHARGRVGRDGKSYPKAPSKQPAKQEQPQAAAEDPLPFETPAVEGMPAYGPALHTHATAVRTLRLGVLRDLESIDAPVSVRQHVEIALKGAESALRLAQPIVCPRCEGLRCQYCGDQGWTTKLAVGER